MISIICAMDKNRGIGINNTLPWSLPADLAHFKKVTLGHPVIMGRKTFESIGRPLPGRENIVITRDKNYSAEGIKVVYSVEESLKEVTGKDAFVIGGSQIYKETLPFVDRLYVTMINETFETDAYFPEIDDKQWEISSRVTGIKDEKNKYDYEFVLYEKITT